MGSMDSQLPQLKTKGKPKVKFCWPTWTYKVLETRTLSFRPVLGRRRSLSALCSYLELIEQLPPKEFPVMPFGEAAWPVLLLDRGGGGRLWPEAAAGTVATFSPAKARLLYFSASPLHARRASLAPEFILRGGSSYADTR